jgi:hypothetical protein
MMSSTGKKHLDHGSGFLVYVIAKHNTTNIEAAANTNNLYRFQIQSRVKH